MNVKEFYSDIVFRRTYAKTQGETWAKAVNRYAKHFRPLAKQLKLEDEFEEAIRMFKDKDIVGSMRALATAGKALELYPEAKYNCSYLIFNDWRAFADMFILLMLGVGVGYSIERHTIGLPKRPPKFIPASITITPDDSKEGWRDSFYTLLTTLQSGLIPKFDYSKIRPAGAPLKTFGGTASGYEPLKFLFEKTIELFISKPGKKWEPVDVFDLANLVANAVISGGVRRSACIAFVDKEDAFKLKPKGFWETKPWRAYSNISITNWTEEDLSYLVDYWRENGTGEPGIFNRKRALKKLIEVGREPGDDTLGGNPCLEVLLRPFETCNLTEINVKPEDTLESLETKIKAGVILGIIQGYDTTFNAVLSNAWHLTAETEPLLGVSLTGLRTHPILADVSETSKKWLKHLRTIARTYAKAIGKSIDKHYTAVTTVKPSGTVSQVLGTTAGLHNSYSRYVIRRLRINAKDPLVEELKNYPIHIEPDIYNGDTLVLEFPLEYPNHKDRDTVEQLDYYSMIASNWADHNPSTTITITNEHWDYVKNWLQLYASEIIGITFLPKFHTLAQAPYEAIDKDTYEEKLKPWKELKFNKQVNKLQLQVKADIADISFSSKTYACSADGGCELDQL